MQESDFACHSASLLTDLVSSLRLVSVALPINRAVTGIARTNGGPRSQAADAQEKERRRSALIALDSRQRCADSKSCASANGHADQGVPQAFVLFARGHP